MSGKHRTLQRSGSRSFSPHEIDTTQEAGR